MLSRIMKEFKQSDGLINLDDLSHRLDIERSALDGMLETLIRQGKLKEVINEQPDCTSCDHNYGCNCSCSSSQSGKVFALN